MRFPDSVTKWMLGCFFFCLFLLNRSVLPFAIFTSKTHFPQTTTLAATSFYLLCRFCISASDPNVSIAKINKEKNIEKKRIYQCDDNVCHFHLYKLICIVWWKIFNYFLRTPENKVENKKKNKRWKKKTHSIDVVRLIPSLCFIRHRK